MSVLYQALNRSVLEREGGERGRAFLLAAAKDLRRKKRRAFLLISALSILFCLQFVGMAYWLITQSKAVSAQHASVPTASKTAGVAENQTQPENVQAAVPAASTEASSALDDSKRGQIKHDLVPEDLAQGISLMETLGEEPATQAKPKTPPTPRPADISVSDKLVPTNPIYAKANDYLTDGAYAKAIQSFDQLLAQAPDDAMALGGKAYALQKQGKFKEAADIDRTLLRLNPNDLKTRANFVSVLVDLGDEDAIDELSLLVGKYPDFAPGLAGLGKMHLEKGKLDEASDFFLRALEVEPKSDVYRLGLAVVYDRMGKSKDALKLYQSVVNEKGKDALPLTSPSIEQRINYLSSQVAP